MAVNEMHLLVWRWLTNIEQQGDSEVSTELGTRGWSFTLLLHPPEVRITLTLRNGVKNTKSPTRSAWSAHKAVGMATPTHPI